MKFIKKSTKDKNQKKKERNNSALDTCIVYIDFFILDRSFSNFHALPVKSNLKSKSKDENKGNKCTEKNAGIKNTPKLGVKFELWPSQVQRFNCLSVYMNVLIFTHEKERKKRWRTSS